MKSPSLKIRVLQRATQLLGDERRLARYLRVPMPELSQWMRGEEEVPQIVFLHAVDLLAEHGGAGETPPPAPDAALPGGLVR